MRVGPCPHEPELDYRRHWLTFLRHWNFRCDVCRVSVHAPVDPVFRLLTTKMAVRQFRGQGVCYYEEPGGE